MSTESTDIVLEGTVSEVYPPDRSLSNTLRDPIEAIADGKHVAIVVDHRYGPDGLLGILRAMAAIRGVGRAPPPPTLVLEDPPFDTEDDIRVPVEETHIENVFVPTGEIRLLEEFDAP